MTIGDKVLLKYYVQSHGTILNVMQIQSKEDLQYIHENDYRVVRVADNTGSFGKVLDSIVNNN